jgi:hypothetical protein
VSTFDKVQSITHVHIVDFVHRKRNDLPSKYKFPCGECEEKFLNVGDRLSHAHKKHGKVFPGVDRFRCPDCDEVVFTKRGLMRHEKRHAADAGVVDKVKRDKVCPYCRVPMENRKFPRHFETVHRDIILKKRPYPVLRVPLECPCCTFQSDVEITYEFHLAEHGMGKF